MEKQQITKRNRCRNEVIAKHNWKNRQPKKVGIQKRELKRKKALKNILKMYIETKQNESVQDKYNR